jgi:hypothetical protein
MRLPPRARVRQRVHRSVAETVDGGRSCRIEDNPGRRKECSFPVAAWSSSEPSRGNNAYTSSRPSASAASSRFANPIRHTRSRCILQPETLVFSHAKPLFENMHRNSRSLSNRPQPATLKVFLWNRPSGRPEAQQSLVQSPAKLVPWRANRLAFTKPPFFIK